MSILATLGTLEQEVIRIKNTSAVMQRAFDYLQYHEKSTNSNLDDDFANAGSGNYTIFAKKYFPSFQGGAWCVMYVFAMVADVFGEANAKKILLVKSAAVKDMLDAFRAAGRIAQEPSRGDLAIWKTTKKSHIAFIYKVDKTKRKYYTIEGNASDKVTVKEYSFDDITAFCRPDWAAVAV